MPTVPPPKTRGASISGAGGMGPYEFFSRVAAGAGICTFKMRPGGGASVIGVDGAAAAWIEVKTGSEEGEFCLAVEGGECWRRVAGWEGVVLGDFGRRGITLRSGRGTIFFKGMPWVIGTDVPDNLRDNSVTTRWIFDFETKGAREAGRLGGGGITFGERGVVVRGGGLEVSGEVVSSPFYATIPLDHRGAGILASLVDGGGRFSADLHEGKVGPLVVRGARGGVALAVAST